MSKDEERVEFSRLRGQALDALRALAFRGVDAGREAELPQTAVDGRIIEVGRVVNDLFRGLGLLDGIKLEWAQDYSRPDDAALREVAKAETG